MYYRGHTVYSVTGVLGRYATHLSFKQGYTDPYCLIIFLKCAIMNHTEEKNKQKRLLRLLFCKYTHQYFCDTLTASEASVLQIYTPVFLRYINCIRGNPNPHPQMPTRPEHPLLTIRIINPKTRCICKLTELIMTNIYAGRKINWMGKSTVLKQR